jgi:hypothetical protein
LKAEHIWVVVNHKVSRAYYTTTITTIWQEILLTRKTHTMLSTISLDIWEPHPHNCRYGSILDIPWHVNRIPQRSGELWNFGNQTFRNFITHSVIWKADSMTLRRAAHERGVTCIRHFITLLDIPWEGKRIPWWCWCGRAAHERRVFCVCCLSVARYAARALEQCAMSVLKNLEDACKR